MPINYFQFVRHLAVLFQSNDCLSLDLVNANAAAIVAAVVCLAAVFLGRGLEVGTCAIPYINKGRHISTNINKIFTNIDKFLTKTTLVKKTGLL